MTTYLKHDPTEDYDTGFNDITDQDAVDHLNQNPKTQAMTEEVYADRVEIATGSNSRNIRGIGCWARFLKFVRGFWDTVLTVDKNDRERMIKVTMKELVIYLIFLLVLCLITFNMTSSTFFYYTTVMQNLFLGSRASDGNFFEDINTIEHFWAFLEQDGPLVAGIHWDKWYNGKEIEINENNTNYIFYENRMLGVPRLRQLRIKKNVCAVHQDFRDDIDDCYAEYSTANQDDTAYGDEKGDAFMWKSEEELAGSGFTSPELKIKYDGAGFASELALARKDSNEKLAYLKDHRWIDRQTRVVFIDFSVYNANVNLFCVIRLVAEFPATGGVIPSSEFRTVRLTNEEGIWGQVTVILEYLYMAMIVYYIIEEILEIRIHKIGYFKNFWNILDVVIIIMSLACAAFRVYRDNKVGSLLSQLSKKVDSYPIHDGTDFEWVSYLQIRYVYLAAFLAFFAWVKLFKYLSFNTTMTQLQLTLSRCATDIAGFSVMFFIIFIGYAQFGYLVFGQTVDNFSSFNESLFTLFRIILGDFDFHELEQADYILGPTFFITYVFLVFFVLLNMFLAIINDTYSDVKEELSQKSSDFQLSDYIKKGYSKVLKRLHLKQEHIKDIQDALNTADINQDKALDWEEWRNDLRLRGIPDNEIEAVFAKYDTDGDMILNESEQKQLQEDLIKTRNAIENEIKGVTENGQAAQMMAESNEAQHSGGIGFGGNDSADGAGPVSGIMSLQGNIDKVVETLSTHFVGHDEFSLVARRIDKLERSVGAVVGKIDAVIRKLESLERLKSQQKNRLASLGKQFGGSQLSLASSSGGKSTKSNKSKKSQKNENNIARSRSRNSNGVYSITSEMPNENSNNSNLNLPLGIPGQINHSNEIQRRNDRSLSRDPYNVALKSEVDDLKPRQRLKSKQSIISTGSNFDSPR